MQNGKDVVPEPEFGDDRSDVGGTTRRDLLRAVGTTALGVVAASLTGEQPAHARYKKRHLYTATRSGHIPIGMVIHKDLSDAGSQPSSDPDLEPGKMNIGDTATVRVISSVKSGAGKFKVTLHDPGRTIRVLYQPPGTNQPPGSDYDVTFLMDSDIGTLQIKGIKATGTGQSARFVLEQNGARLVATIIVS